MARLKGSQEGAMHHCISRCVQGQRLLDEKGRGVFRRMLWRVADFSGVNILTYCIMGNHFHILVEIPDAKAEISDAELVRRYGVLFDKPTKFMPFTPEELKEQLARGDAQAEKLRGRLLRRMHDVSEFMRTLKLRFSLWYNKTHNTYGIFWAGRFTNLLVDGASYSLQTVAAYIDLNPVRAGLVNDPKDYPDCGYGEAVAGGKLAQRGVARVMHRFDDSEEGRIEAYRQLLWGKGSAPKEGKAQLVRPTKGNNEAAVADRSLFPKIRKTVLQSLGYMTRGVAIGTMAFVETAFSANSLRSPKCIVGWTGEPEDFYSGCFIGRNHKPKR